MLEFTGMSLAVQQFNWEILPRSSRTVISFWLLSKWQSNYAFGIHLHLRIDLKLVSNFDLRNSDNNFLLYLKKIIMIEFTIPKLHSTSYYQDQPTSNTKFKWALQTMFWNREDNFMQAIGLKRHSTNSSMKILNQILIILKTQCFTLMFHPVLPIRDLWTFAMANPISWDNADCCSKWIRKIKILIC